MTSDVSPQVNNPMVSEHNSVKEVKNNDTAVVFHQPQMEKVSAEKPIEPILTNTPPTLPDQTEESVKQDIFVSRSAVCAALDGRNPVGRQHIFSIKENNHTIVWTEIKSTQIPTCTLSLEPRILFRLVISIAAP